MFSVNCGVLVSFLQRQKKQKKKMMKFNNKDIIILKVFKIRITKLVVHARGGPWRTIYESKSIHKCALFFFYVIIFLFVLSLFVILMMINIDIHIPSLLSLTLVL